MDFYVPFYDDIADVSALGGRNLVCWSTGANIALKAEKLNFENIILVSPFIKFTDFTNERILRRMIKRFSAEPDAVINDFMSACGCPAVMVPQDADYDKLKNGLEYLLDSGEGINKTHKSVTILHGEEDAIVNISSGEQVSEMLGCRLVRLKSCGHYVSPEIIREYLI